MSDRALNFAVYVLLAVLYHYPASARRRILKALNVAVKELRA